MKLLLIALSLCACFFITACGEDNSTSPTSSEPAASETATSPKDETGADNKEPNETAPADSDEQTSDPGNGAGDASDMSEAFIKLHPMDVSKQIGEVIYEERNGSLFLHVLFMEQPPGEHAVMIYQGSCHEGGPRLEVLEPYVDNNHEAVVEGLTLEKLMEPPHVLIVREGETEDTPPIACAEFNNSTHAME